MTPAYRPYLLTGYYRYIELSEITEKEPHIIAKAWKAGAVIGQVEHILDTTSIYTQFEIGIDYTVNIIPDSLTIVLQSDIIGGTPQPADGLLYIDMLGVDPGQVEPVGLHLQQEIEIDIYPNPADGELIIQLGDGVFDYQLVDLNGQILISGISVQGRHIVDVSELSAGSYVVLLQDESGYKVRRTVVLR